LAPIGINYLQPQNQPTQNWLHLQEAVDLWEVEQKFKQNPALAPTALSTLVMTA